jgi:ribosomal protein L11 methyltransferase
MGFNVMPFLELTLPCREAEQPRLEHALEDVGALSVTMMDAHAEAADEQAIFEPGVGEQPLWREMAISALFPAASNPDAILAALEAFDHDLDLSGAQFREVADQDWERAWMDRYRPMRFGRRLWITPWNLEPEAAADAGEQAQRVIVRLDPGLAFGTGTHPTTALCLEWLDTLADAGDLQDRGILDFGCGSGILAIAALKLGAARATGVDNDPQALAASADNAQRNGVGDRIALHLAGDDPTATYPVVVANILAVALDKLAPLLAERTAAGGRVALSGILSGQEDELLLRYAPWFDDLRVARREDWIRIDARRR